MTKQAVGRRRKGAGALGVLLGVWSGLAVLSCAAPDTVRPEDQASIRATLEDYLPKLATAYATGEVEVLRDVAAEKELAGLYKRIRELWADGRILEPSFKSVTLEQVDVWSHSNAFVTTLEVWDLEVYSSGTRRLLSEARDQRNLVKYQLKREGDGWLVLYRAIENTYE